MKAKNNTNEFETVMVTGYAPAPKGTTMHHLFNYAGVVLEISLAQNIIVNAQFTFVTDLSKGFFSRLICGYDLNNDPECLYDLIRAHVWTPSTEAIIACLRIALQRYFDTRSKM